jgi:Protein of unknown function (DUF1638)
MNIISVMKLNLIACRVLWRELSFFAAQSPHIIEYGFLEQGLHITPDKLKEEVQAKIDNAEDTDCDAIILGYGLCSNGVVGIKSKNKKIVIPRAHDCITFLLGSKERYGEYTKDNPCAYWYSPGWIETGTQPSGKRVDETRAFYIKQYGEDNGEYLMETMESWMINYKKAAYVDLDTADSAQFRKYTEKCAEDMGWETEFLKGDPKLVKELLSGDWDKEHFLILSPGEEAVPSYDDRIIKAKNADSR